MPPSRDEVSLAAISVTSRVRGRHWRTSRDTPCRKLWGDAAGARPAVLALQLHASVISHTGARAKTRAVFRASNVSAVHVKAPATCAQRRHALSNLSTPTARVAHPLRAEAANRCSACTSPRAIASRMCGRGGRGQTSRPPYPRPPPLTFRLARRTRLARASRFLVAIVASFSRVMLLRNSRPSRCEVTANSNCRVNYA